MTSPVPDVSCFFLSFFLSVRVIPFFLKLVTRFTSPQSMTYIPVFYFISSLIRLGGHISLTPLSAALLIYLAFDGTFGSHLSR